MKSKKTNEKLDNYQENTIARLHIIFNHPQSHEHAIDVVVDEIKYSNIYPKELVKTAVKNAAIKYINCDTKDIDANDFVQFLNKHYRTKIISIASIKSHPVIEEDLTM